ncbi:uncharacterized protein MEPE_00789 [Melanopsichium pennsylvanicum]|uniref:Uncharacterized protein n=2 Tax=Melanopsichium pennsylvanicum TaxID=63383 RepID=A0AAJ4XH70_9BASI|nr:uncharacterized protein MEPE_00789 [Melanopsichium pennsylvanicum]
MGASPIPLAGTSKKRKAFDDLESFSNGEAYQIRPKLSLPRSAGLVFNGEAQFHPLPADVNQAMLAQLGNHPFASSASNSSFVTPSSSSSSFMGHESKLSNSSDYFSSTTTHYPDVEPYPFTSPSSSFGILGPAPGEGGNGMDMDDCSSTGSNGTGGIQIHGQQCKSIPQLCVRYNNGTGSELWATCADCGACSKVEADRPSSNLCYSP